MLLLFGFIIKVTLEIVLILYFKLQEVLLDDVEQKLDIEFG